MLFSRKDYKNLIRKIPIFGKNIKTRHITDRNPLFFKMLNFPGERGGGRFQKYMKHVGAIETLAKMKNKKLKEQFIRHMSREELLGIKEIVNALLRGDIHAPREFKKLRKYATPMRQIARGASSQKTKQILKQHGGFLSILAPLAAKMLMPMIPGLLGNILK